MDRIDCHSALRAASVRMGRHAVAWLALWLPALGEAQAANVLDRLHLPDAATLLVLGAGFGVVLIAAGVLVFAIRQLRREAEERRRLYNRHRRGSHANRSHLRPPPAPMTD